MPNPQLTKITKISATSGYEDERAAAIELTRRFYGAYTAASFSRNLGKTEQDLKECSFNPDRESDNGYFIKGCFEFEIYYKISNGELIFISIVPYPDAFYNFY
jgi:hypothetical protein